MLSLWTVKVVDTNVVVSAVLTRGKPEAVSRLRMATLKDDLGLECLSLILTPSTT